MKYEDAIIKALKGCGLPKNVTLILSDRDGVEPKAPYVMVNIIDTWNIGTARKTYSNKGGKLVETLFQTKDINASLTFHMSAIDPLQDWLEVFQMGLSADVYEWWFVQSGLGVVDHREVVYQSLPIDGKNYKRGILDITFRTERVQDFFVNVVDKIDVQGSLGITDKDVDLTIDFKEGE